MRRQPYRGRGSPTAKAWAARRPQSCAVTKEKANVELQTGEPTERSGERDGRGDIQRKKASTPPRPAQGNQLTGPQLSPKTPVRYITGEGQPSVLTADHRAGATCHPPWFYDPCSQDKLSGSTGQGRPPLQIWATHWGRSIRTRAYRDL